MGNQWKNWSSSVKGTPSQILFPKSEVEIQEIVKKANQEGRKIRVVGAGHSFTPLAQTSQILISLDQLTGLVSVDKSKKQAVAYGGTRLKTLCALLKEQGLGMVNQGDIDVQSIAGAISTGTHGTGVNFGTLATQIVSLTLVNGSGELIHLDPNNMPEKFKAAQVSLGTMGVITRIGLQLTDAYKLKFTSAKGSLDEVLQKLEEYKSQHRHFEFYWFPFTKTVQTKILDVSQEKPKGNGLGAWFNDMFMENGVFWLLSKISKNIPGAFRRVSKLSAWGVSASSKVAWSHEAFSTSRLVKFQEMEYNIPSEHFKDVLWEIEACITEFNFRVHFPVECRWVKADDIWMSPAYERESAYIAVHMYKGMAYKEYFGAIEAIFKKHNGRPHWGKMHTLNKDELKSRYPKWNDFQTLRKKMDPQGVFLNGYLEKLFAD